MNKMPGMLPVLLMFFFNVFTQQQAVIKISAQMVNPIGVSLQMSRSNSTKDIVLYNQIVENKLQISQASFVNTHSLVYIKSIHIANLQIENNNSGTYDLLSPDKIILTNQTRQGFIPLHCYATRMQRPNGTDEIVMINAAIEIQSDQALGKYVSDMPVTIMVNYN